MCICLLLYKYLSNILNFAFWPISLKKFTTWPTIEKFVDLCCGRKINWYRLSGKKFNKMFHKLK